MEILLPSSISFEAYPRFALSYSVSCSGSRLCFPVSRCACNDTKRLYALMHPSSGHGKSGEAYSFSPSASSCSRLFASLAAFGSLADFLFTCLCLTFLKDGLVLNFCDGDQPLQEFPGPAKLLQTETTVATFQDPH